MSHDLYAKRRQVADHLERQVARAIIETGGTAPQHPNDARAISKLPGDVISLRGFPIRDHGVPGAILGTNPLAALMAKQPRDEA